MASSFMFVSYFGVNTAYVIFIGHTSKQVTTLSSARHRCSIYVYGSGMSVCLCVSKIADEIFL